MFNDMNIFHKFVYKIIPVTMPDYLTLYSGDSRLRSTYFDNLSFVSNIASTTTSISNLNKSFLFRSHMLWNFLPFDLTKANQQLGILKRTCYFVTNKNRRRVLYLALVKS